jgi:hypothetical protein
MRVQAILREPLLIQKVGSRREQDQKIRQLLEGWGSRRMPSSDIRTSSRVDSASGSRSPGR